MSRNHRGMTIREWFSYMQNLASQHGQIQHGVNGRKAFARMRFTEALEQQFTQLATTGPVMLVETYEEDGIDNKSNNLMARRHAAWHICMRLSGQQGDVAQLLAKEEDCQRVAKEVLARMRRDRLNYDDQRFADVQLENWQGDSSTALFGGSWAAWRIQVSFTHVDRDQVFDAQDWDDTTGPADVVDVTGLSCQNLNDPFNGLTATQRLNCILPTYDFSDDTVFNALTDQQEADLRARLGSSTPPDYFYPIAIGTP